MIDLLQPYLQDHEKVSRNNRTESLLIIKNEKYRVIRYFSTNYWNHNVDNVESYNA